MPECPCAYQALGLCGCRCGHKALLLLRSLGCLCKSLVVCICSAQLAGQVGVALWCEGFTSTED